MAASDTNTIPSATKMGVSLNWVPLRGPQIRTIAVVYIGIPLFMETTVLLRDV